MPTIATMAITEEETLFMVDMIGTETELMIFLTIKALYQLIGEDENFLNDEQLERLGEEVLKGAEAIDAAVKVYADVVAGEIIGSKMVQ